MPHRAVLHHKPRSQAAGAAPCCSSPQATFPGGWCRAVLFFTTSHVPRRLVPCRAVPDHKPHPRPQAAGASPCCSSPQATSPGQEQHPARAAAAAAGECLLSLAAEACQNLHCMCEEVAAITIANGIPRPLVGSPGRSVTGCGVRIQSTDGVITIIVTFR